jgi:hypothetical protein
MTRTFRTTAPAEGDDGSRLELLLGDIRDALDAGALDAELRAILRNDRPCGELCPVGEEISDADWVLQPR